MADKRRLLESTNLFDIPASEQQLKNMSLRVSQGMKGERVDADAQVKAFEEAKKAECEAKGGTWDNATRTCKLPEPKLNTPEVIRDEKTGEITGVTLPDGRQFLGISPKNVKSLISGFQGVEELNKGLPIGTEEAGTTQNLINARARNQQLVNSIIGEPLLTEQDILNAVPQETGLENLQAGGAGVAGGVAGGFGGALLGAKIGGIGGTFVTPGIGTAIGAVGGAIVGLAGGAYTKISLDKRNDIKQAKKVGTIAYTNFGQTTDALNAGKITRDQAIKRWNEDRISLYAARRNLQRDTSTDLNRFLSGGADELAQIEDYIRDLETFKTQEFLTALENPNPKNIKYIYQTGETLENE